jgi:hypothetical protein
MGWATFWAIFSQAHLVTLFAILLSVNEAYHRSSFILRCHSFTLWMEFLP